jgi:hypothetical protein
MFSIFKNSRLFQRSFLMRLLQTTGLSLALMTASAAGVHAEDVTVQGANGANGADGVNPGDDGQPGETGGPATAVAASGTDPLNSATAMAGNGGNGGNVPSPEDSSFPGNGGTGGTAMATAATTIIFGSAGATANATGGNGGFQGANNDGEGGSGGPATALATGSSGNGSATASASATGGNGGGGDVGGGGGDASATSTAMANGSGDALSSANATGGAPAEDSTSEGGAHNVTAMADAAAAGGGKAIATAVATNEFPSFVFPSPLNATSTAETVNGAMAKAMSIINPNTDSAGTSEATAKTSFGGVSVQSDATNTIFPDFATVEAIAQGGSAQINVAPDAISAISVSLPDKAFATTLIDGASNVAAALLGPRDEIFGAAILDLGSSTFDFSYQGDLLLGLIGDFVLDVTVNGAEVSVGDPGDNTVINLGSFGSNIDLTISGEGTFVIGGAVPEPSTWAMVLIGFAGLGFAGYRSTRRIAAAT